MLSGGAAAAMVAAADYAAVAVFAATGALAAARAKHTIVTFAFFAALTGIGGGTLRDLLIGAPVFWVRGNGYVALCLGVALAVWLSRAERWPYAVLLWLDAVGLAVAAVAGTAKALGLGVPPLVATAMGVLTASFGGIMRDVLAHEPSVLLRREIYVSAALLAAGGYAALQAAGMTAAPAALVGGGAGFLLRAAGLGLGWTLPGYHRSSFPDEVIDGTSPK